MEIIQVDSVAIEVVRKKIKRLNLGVFPPDGRVRISAPKYLPIENIQEFAQSKLLWIQKNQTKIKSRPPKKQLHYVTGEHIDLWGQPHQLTVLDQALINQIDRDESHISAFFTGNPTLQQKQNFFHEWYIKQLFPEADRLIHLWKAKVGADISHWRIREMKTRWGSYSSLTRTISISLELVKKPVQCLEYLVVHELAHVFVPGHGKKFKQFMDRHLPDWRARRKILNQSVK